MKQFNHFMTAVMATFILAGAETVTDEQIGYSLHLPDNWIKSEVNSLQHLFEDTSGTYQSMIAILKYDFSEETVFTSEKEWARANFIAYALSIDVDPFSVMVFYDTVSATQNETLWAADAFSQFFSIDTTLTDWAEYVRFTASGTNGYEIYAIGPVDDMEANIGFYLTIIETITLPEIKMINIVVPKGLVGSQVTPSYNKVGTFDLLGRRESLTSTIPSVNRMLVFRTHNSLKRKITLRQMYHIIGCKGKTLQPFDTLGDL